MKKNWKLFIFKLERDRKLRNDVILLSLSVVIVLVFAGMMFFRNPQNQFAEITDHSTSVSTNSITTPTSSTDLHQSSDTETSEMTDSSVKDLQPSIEEFAGGWGGTQSETVFFVNSDESTSSIALDGSIASFPMENLYLYYTEDGRSALSYSENGVSKEIIKELDGTLTSDGEVFQHLGDSTIEEYQNDY